MRRLFVFVLIALAWIGVLRADAQLSLRGVGGGFGAAAGGGYTGPGDIVAGALGYWSPSRCYSTATSMVIVTVVDNATGVTTESAIRCASGGVISVSATNADCPTVGTCSPLASTCASGCRIENFFDQTGNGQTATNGSNGLRPNYIQSGIGSNAVARFAGGQFMTFTAAATTTVPYTVYATAKNTSSVEMVAFSSGSFNGVVGMDHSSGGANTAWIYSGGAAAQNGTATDSVYHQVLGIIAASPIIYVDGSSAGSGASIGTGSFTGSSHIGAGAGAPGDPWIGDIVEVSLYGSTLSAGNASSLSSSAKTFFGY